MMKQTIKKKLSSGTKERNTMMDDILTDLSKKLASSKKQAHCHAKYGTLSTDEERVKYTLSLLNAYGPAPWIPEPHEKSESTSNTLRTDGNCAFLTPRPPLLDETILCYTKSIVFAPTDSREMALGYANRSAALFHAGLYDDCLNDINRALKLPYPDNLKAKLYYRQARCFMILVGIDSNEFNDALNNAANYVHHIPEQSPNRKAIEELIYDRYAVPLPPIKYKKWSFTLPNIIDENKEIPGVSSALKLEYNQEYGRHIVATRDIKPGELLAVMKPYAAVLVKEKAYTHCDYCFEQTWSSVPCPGCCEVIYCNDNCRLQAWKNYHEIECQVVRHLILLGMSNLGLLSLHLVVKAVAEAGSIDKLREKINNIDKNNDDPRTLGFINGIFNDCDYTSTYTLVRNTDKRSVPDLFGRSLNAAYVAYFLATRSKFFGEIKNGHWDIMLKDKDILFIGGLIMRHQQIIPSNAHSLTEESIAANPAERAAVIMPFYSLINHSCEPHVSRVAYGSHMALFSDCSIGKGEQVFDQYGVHYAIMTKKDRQAKLKKQYRFTCNCIACNEDWQTYRHLDSFINQDYDIEIKERLRQVMQNFDSYYHNATVVTIDNYQQTLDDLNYMTIVLERVIKKPTSDFNDIVETRKRLWGLLGSRYQLLDQKYADLKVRS